MRVKWTREEIIRQVLQREAAGLPLNIGGQNGVPTAMYQAASRVFGSWRNAVKAAGIPQERAVAESWSAARILLIIRNLSRRHRPLTIAQLDRRYGGLVTAARRVFGSWTKAIVAAGANPQRFQRVLPWTKERVLETILTHELQNAPLSPRMVQPRALLEAGQRFFGSWAAALTAAGLDPEPYTPLAIPIQHAAQASDTQKPSTRETVLTAITCRLNQKCPLSAKSVDVEDHALFRAAINRFGNWGEALRAAGLDPLKHRYRRPPKPEQPDRKEFDLSQPDEPMRPDHPT